MADNSQVKKMQHHLTSALAIIESPSFGERNSSPSRAAKLAEFMHLCDSIEISIVAGMLIVHAYEKGEMTLGDVRKLLHISETQKISIADYFRKKQTLSPQSVQDYFNVEDNPKNKTEKVYILNENGKIAAQTLISAFDEIE